MGEGPTDCDPGGLLLSGCRRGGDGGEVHPCLKAWAHPGVGLGEGSGALQDTDPNLFPGIPGLRLGELEGPGEKARISLLAQSLPGDHHSSESWLNEPQTVSP